MKAKETNSDTKHLSPKIAMPNFTSALFLNGHIDDVLNFYLPNCFDKDGGFYHYFNDEGEVYNSSHRHLVSATRFVVNWVQAWQHKKDPLYLKWAGHALRHLDEKFKTHDGDYVWTLKNQEHDDTRIMAYGQAFVLLSKSWGLCAKLCSIADVRAVFDRMDTVFYDEQDHAGSF